MKVWDVFILKKNKYIPHLEWEEFKIISVHNDTYLSERENWKYFYIGKENVIPKTKFQKWDKVVPYFYKCRDRLTIVCFLWWNNKTYVTKDDKWRFDLLPESHLEKTDYFKKWDIVHDYLWHDVEIILDIWKDDKWYQAYLIKDRWEFKTITLESIRGICQWKLRDS